MRDHGSIAPAFWTDHLGRRWKVPQILGRLKPGKCQGHMALREYVIHRDGHRCRLCGRGVHSTPPVLLVADHIVSRRNGGSHHPDNLRALCQSCNSSKSGSEDVGRPLKVKRLGIGVIRKAVNA
jgi:hypothetical protein